MEPTFLTNRMPSQQQIDKIISLGELDDPVLFAIFGSISAKANYSTSVLLVSRGSLLAYDFSTDEQSERIRFSDVKRVFNKRMYGNGIVRVEKNSGEILNLFRFTFSVTALCDAAAAFVNDLNAGVSFEDAIESVKGTYEKQLSVCPKCGRTLASPGTPCINCMDKGRLVKKLGSYLKPQLGLLIISILISVGSTVLILMPPYLTRSLVDDILPNRDRNALLNISILLLIIYVLRYALSGIRGYMLRIVGSKLIAALRREVYEKAQHLPMRFYDRTSTGSVINRINGDTATLQSFMLRLTSEVVVEFFRMIGIIVVMLVIDWKLTLLSLIPVPIVVIGSRIFKKKIAPFYRRIWRRSTAVTSVLTDTVPGIRVVKSFANEKNVTDRFSNCVEEWRKTEVRAGKILNAYPAIVNCLVALGTVFIWSFGGNLAIKGLETGGMGAGTITVGLLVSFISYASMFYEPVNFFANFSDSVQSASASTERIMDILDAEPEHNFGEGNTNVNMGGKIKFKHVTFSFDRTKKVLKDVNLVINPGDIVGIVGTTGSGKSTLINLLLRYYDHYEGTIKIDGVDIRNIDMHYYRSKIGYVQQEPMMFHDTVFNNIAYGDGSFSADEVIAAADIANAHEFICRQPDGYDCVLGERGTGLSGGERQRVSIARAMLRNPKLLVFDEATASVDSETEHLIQDAIEKLISGRTTIMIAHRLSTLSKANKIVVVDNGQIIECGTPQELMEQKGKYYRLVQIQSMSDKVAADRRAENFD